MCDGDIDAYVAKFDLLIDQAGYQANDPQTLEKFVNGLPASLYEPSISLTNLQGYNV